MAIKVKIKKSAHKRFWSKVAKIKGSCWNWIAAKNACGYGVFGYLYETDKAHRVSWMISNGEIPKGLFVCHKCDNPSCVNPDHLFLGTAKNNHDDMVRKKRNSKPPPMGGWNKMHVSKEIIEMLGKAPDTHLARMMGCSKAVISRKRRELKIDHFPCQTRFKKGQPHPRWSKEWR